MFLSIPQSRSECQIYLQNYQGRRCTSPSVFQPMLLFEHLVHVTLLSIPQSHLNVKFILRHFRKNVDSCGTTVHGDIKYTTNRCECQIYFFAIPEPFSFIVDSVIICTRFEETGNNALRIWAGTPQNCPTTNAVLARNKCISNSKIYYKKL